MELSNPKTDLYNLYITDHKCQTSDQAGTRKKFSNNTKVNQKMRFLHTKIQYTCWILFRKNLKYIDEIGNKMFSLHQKKTNKFQFFTGKMWKSNYNTQF